MLTKTTLLALSLGSFTFLAPLSMSPSPVQAVGKANPSKFAGVYLSNIQSTDLFTGVLTNGQVLSSYSADGTLTQSDTNDAAGILSSTIGSDSPGYGTWTKTGPLSTTQTALWFSYDEDGALEFTGRSDWDTDVSQDLKTISGSGTIRIYFPGMDAMDVDAGIPVATYTFDGRTLNP